MSEHLSAQIMGRYLRRELSPEELLATDDHLFECETCRESTALAIHPEEILLSVRENLTVDQRAAEREHIAYEQLTALVDNELSLADREIAESHLDLCQLCHDEVEDLRAFRAALAHAPPEQKVLTTVAPPFKGKRAEFSRLFSLPLSLRVAAALALLFVALTAVLLWRQSRPAPEVVQTTPTPASNEPPPPSPGGSPESTQTPGGSNDSSTQITMVLEDGDGHVTLDARGAIKGLEALSSEAQRAVRSAVTSGRVERSDSLAGLSGRAGTLMGGPQNPSGTFSLLSPVGIVTRADRPRLSWRPLPKASAYTVTVLDPDLGIVATSPSLSTTTWTPPDALARGRVYTWQVSAIKDGQKIISPIASAPEARFRVLDKRKDDELRRLERTNGRSHLARGVLYAQAGLLDEAAREFSALLNANPKSPVARSLLQSVKRR